MNLLVESQTNTRIPCHDRFLECLDLRLAPQHGSKSQSIEILWLINAPRIYAGEEI